MAGDQGIANAYANYFQAQEQADLQKDPFYIFTQLATRAAQEWTFEKKKDGERARKKADGMQDRLDETFSTVLEGYNPQTQQLGYDHLEVFTNRMDVAAKAGDKKQMSQINSEAKAFAMQLQKGQNLMQEHAKNLNEGTYSEGAGTATENKFLSADMGDYETFMETDPSKPGYNQLHFKTKDNNGGIEVFSLDDMGKYNVKRADQFGDGYDKLIKGMVKEATNTGVYEFDRGQVKKLVKRNLADGDVLYSAFHDPIFGEDESIKQQFNKNYKANKDWQNIWNDKIPAFQATAETGSVVSGAQMAQNSGYNEEAIRTITEDKLMTMAEKEFNMRLKAYQKKVAASKTTGDKGNKMQIGDYQYADKDVMETIAKNIKNRQNVVFEGQKYVPDGESGWLDEEGNPINDNAHLIAMLDKNRGYIRNKSLFTNLIKPTL